MKIRARRSSLFVRIIFHSREFYYWWLRSWYEFILVPNCFLIPLCLLNRMIREFYTSCTERNRGTFSDIYDVKIESADRYVPREQQNFVKVIKSRSITMISITAKSPSTWSWSSHSYFTILGLRAMKQAR